MFVIDMENLDQQIAEIRKKLRDDTVHLHALLAARVARRTGSEDPGPLDALERTQAILTVLRSAEEALSPKEIRQRLLDGDRDDPLNTVTATLSHLLGRGEVERPARGKYLAI